MGPTLNKSLKAVIHQLTSTTCWKLIYEKVSLPDHYASQSKPGQNFVCQDNMPDYLSLSLFFNIVVQSYFNQRQNSAISQNRETHDRTHIVLSVSLCCLAILTLTMSLFDSPSWITQNCLKNYAHQQRLAESSVPGMSGQHKLTGQHFYTSQALLQHVKILGHFEALLLAKIMPCRVTNKEQTCFFACFGCWQQTKQKLYISLQLNYHSPARSRAPHFTSAICQLLYLCR